MRESNKREIANNPFQAAKGRTQFENPGGKLKNWHLCPALYNQAYSTPPKQKQKNNTWFLRVVLII